MDLKAVSDIFFARVKIPFFFPLVVGFPGPPAEGNYPSLGGECVGEFPFAGDEEAFNPSRISLFPPDRASVNAEVRPRNFLTSGPLPF